MRIPETLRKLGEAQRFFAALLEDRKSGHLNISGRAESFHENLSAFLSAGRSVTLVLQSEQKAMYDAWFPSWKAALPQSDQEILDFFKEERNAESHNKGARITRDIEHISVTEIIPDHGLHPAYGYGVTWTAPVGTPPPTVGRAIHYFEIGGKAVEVSGACRGYLSILERVVHEFEGSLVN